MHGLAVLDLLARTLATLVVAAWLPAPTLLAQGPVQVPLNYNWNGIAHAGETGQPDAPNGFRSISDRALDFTGGVPTDPVLSRYALVGTAGALDMVHLGNRNTVDNGNWAFDSSPNSNAVGTQPSWLSNPNQTGSQTTNLTTPIPLGLQSQATVLFHVSNGGGSCDVTFSFQSGATATRTITAPDWFNGAFAGRDSVDRADAGNNLGLVEATLDLSAFAGEALTRIAFGNRSNTNAGYGIYAVNVVPAPEPATETRIALNYNWNGIVHAGEAGLPDAPNGYRSIADKGLDFRTGVPATPLLAGFDLVAAPGSPDLVMLGNRNAVGSAQYPFDPLPDGDNLGTQPAWLPNPDLTGPQTTTLATPVLLDGSSTASFLYQMSHGGGAFDVTFTFATASITTTLTASDWAGGSYLALDDVDRAQTFTMLRIEDATIDLSPASGLVLTAITFGNSSNSNGSCAILAATVTGCLSCSNSGGPFAYGGGNGPTMSTSATGALGCPLDWQVQGATPGTLLGRFALSFRATGIQLSSVFPACSGTIHVDMPLTAVAFVDATGTATFSLPAQTDPGFCGLAIIAQYAELVPTSCPVLLSDALSITIGN
ncbi:MAG: hypothetical protein NXI31_13175 [bacterium]|nr:hypothetical protein [bacterium]